MQTQKFTNLQRNVLFRTVFNFVLSKGATYHKSKTIMLGFPRVVFFIKHYQGEIFNVNPEFPKTLKTQIRSRMVSMLFCHF